MSSPITLELQAKIATWRLRVADGTITQDEMKEAIIHLRAGRLAAAQSAAASKRKASIAAIPAAADLLDELDGV